MASGWTVARSGFTSATARGVKRYCNTTVKEEDGNVEVTLYSTVIFTRDREGNMLVNIGGWNTVTTRKRINECLKEFGGGIANVYTDRRVPLVRTDVECKPFTTECVISNDGHITSDRDFYYPVPVTLKGE